MNVTSTKPLPSAMADLTIKIRGLAHLVAFHPTPERCEVRRRFHIHSSAARHTTRLPHPRGSLRSRCFRSYGQRSPRRPHRRPSNGSSSTAFSSSLSSAFLHRRRPPRPAASTRPPYVPSGLSSSSCAQSRTIHRLPAADYPRSSQGSAIVRRRCRNRGFGSLPRVRFAHNTSPLLGSSTDRQRCVAGLSARSNR